MLNIPHVSFVITHVFRYKFEEVSAKEIEKLKTQAKLNSLKEEKMKEHELSEKIKTIRKKQEEEIAKYIGTVGNLTLHHCGH